MLQGFRWYTHHACISRFLLRLIRSNQFAEIKPPTAESRAKKEHIYKTISDDKFWEKLQECEKILKPTSKYIGRLESDDCNLSDIYKSFLELLNCYKDNSEILKLVEERWCFVHTPSMGFAYFLDPKTRAGQRMVGDDVILTDGQLRKFIVDGWISYSHTQKEKYALTRTQFQKKLIIT